MVELSVCNTLNILRVLVKLHTITRTEIQRESQWERVELDLSTTYSVYTKFTANTFRVVIVIGQRPCSIIFPLGVLHKTEAYTTTGIPAESTPIKIFNFALINYVRVQLKGEATIRSIVCSACGLPRGLQLSPSGSCLVKFVNTVTAILVSRRSRILRTTIQVNTEVSLDSDVFCQEAFVRNAVHSTNGSTDTVLVVLCTNCECAEQQSSCE